MQKKKILWFSFGWCLAVLFLFFHTTQVFAKDMPKTADNLETGIDCTSNLVSVEKGYMRVFYHNSKINIEYYDEQFHIQSSKSVNMELPLWGGFYAGSNAYYVVEGSKNSTESNLAEVIRVIKYDKNWKRISAASITSNSELFGGEVRTPFDYGSTRMTEQNGTLYIVSGHEGYVDPQFQMGHQGFLLIEVNEASMTGKITDCDLWHSFAQYIAGDDSGLYILEQSEGSRCTKLSKYKQNAEGGSFDSKRYPSFPVFEYGGSHTSSWAIACYATVNGLALSSDHILSIGTSIDQSKYDQARQNPYNIYLTVTSKSNPGKESTTVKWLTNYTNADIGLKDTKLVKINDHRFMVLWQEESKQSGSVTNNSKNLPDINDTLSNQLLRYLFIDGSGNIISKEFTAAAPLTDCDLIVKGSKAVYYGSNDTMVNFYSIDTKSGKFDKKTYRLAGEHATWEISKSKVLTISGSGEITSLFDNYDDIEKIVIKSGITSIPDHAFQYLEHLKEVEMEQGVKTIGNRVFYGCEKLSKIVVPASVNQIGEEFLSTGFYWISSHKPVYYATIYAPFHSYAIDYAKKNHISYVEMITNAKITGLKKNYVYSGKSIKPKVKVKLGNQILKKDRDYKITYFNNKKIGRGRIKITGLKKWNGTIKKTFCILPKKGKITKVVSKKSKMVLLKWKKDKKITGYQLTYSKSPKFKKAKSKSITKKSIGSIQISGLKSRTKYYVKIRCYKKVKGKRYYGV